MKSLILGWLAFLVVAGVVFAVGSVFGVEPSWSEVIVAVLAYLAGSAAMGFAERAAS